MGLPNVGKSTLFNALLKKQAALAANYPFATIEPNVGIVPVPDERLAKLAEAVHTNKIVNATVKFVDIAGLVKGASQGEGLGNKFLSHIREVDAIMYVIRDFADENIIRAGSTNPQDDLDILKLELQLADEQSKEKTNLLVNKPAIVVYNVDETSPHLTAPLSLVRRGEGGEVLYVSAKLESDLAELSEEEQKEYLKQLGIEKTGLEKVIQEAFKILGLQTFLTAGEIEARAWTIKKGTLAPQAAGKIHADFEKHFIKADCVYWEDFVKYGGWVKCREAGRVRTEGRDYIMQEGDVVEFKVGV